jgi:AcrR family transcriptional regulator
MTKSDIVKAAFSAWESDVYKSMSLSVLASYLGVSKTALYRHFKNKEAIVDAMFLSFFEEYIDHVKPKFEEALKEKDEIKGFFILVRGITEFYVRNRTVFTFALCQLHEHKDNSHKNMRFQMENHGIDLLKLPFFKSHKNYFMIAQLSSTIAVFMTAVFFYSGKENPSEDEIQQLLDRTEHQIAYGLGFNTEELNCINYDELDAIISQALPSDTTGNDSLLKAVANAIAQTESGDASMELVAKGAGLSKSGLYSHFKSKEDMLRQFFTIEFEKIYRDFEVFPKTEKPEEQLYLLIASSINYLQARSEIMIALNWIRTKHLDLGLSMPEAIVSRFSDPRFVKINTEEENVHDNPLSTNPLPLSLGELPHFMIFCIMGHLKSNYFMEKEISLSRENIRFFYKILISGIKGGKI